MIYKVKRFSSRKRKEENRRRDLELGKMECGKWDKTFKENHKYNIESRQDSGNPEVTKEDTLIHLGRIRRHRMERSHSNSYN